MRSRSNQKAKVRAPRQKLNKIESGLPPDLQAVPAQRVRRRFHQTGALTGTPFLMQEGAQQFGVCHSVGYALPTIDMWRLRRIDLYLTGDDKQVVITPTSTDGATNFINSRERSYTLSSMNDAQSRHLAVGPANDYDPLFSWHHANTINQDLSLFLLTSNSNSGLVMDLTFEVVYNWVGAASSLVWATSTGLGTQGGYSCVGGHMVPVGINSLG